MYQVKHFGGTLSLLVATLLLVSVCMLDAAPAKETSRKPTSWSDGAFEITTDDLSDDTNNNILLYEPLEPRQVDFKTSESQNANNKKLKSSSFTVTGRDLAGSSGVGGANVKLAESQAEEGERSGLPNADAIKHIALNSREVRLVGPNQREVEMKDDLQTKVVVALENLQKEAKEVYGQVNEKLDKSWTELKNSEVWGQMNDKLDKGWTDVKKAEVWGQINDKLDQGWTDLKGMFESVVNSNNNNNNKSG